MTSRSSAGFGLSLPGFPSVRMDYLYLCECCVWFQEGLALASLPGWGLARAGKSVPLLAARKCLMGLDSRREIGVL